MHYIGIEFHLGYSDTDFCFFFVIIFLAFLFCCFKKGEKSLYDTPGTAEQRSVPNGALLPMECTAVGQSRMVLVLVEPLHYKE